MSTPLSYFQSASWCAAWLSHPDLRIDTSASNPFRETTKHDDAWKDRTFLYRASQDPQGVKSEGYIVMQIGAGVSGKDGVAHGGFLATLMDELTGGLVAALGLDRGLGIRTASLNTTYHKLLLAQGFIMARAEIVKVERRKVFVKAEIRDAAGNVSFPDYIFRNASTGRRFNGKSA
ncbi:HotDog domain-containing protein [Aspergillus novoparasiticus]|uniref:HotDog domain-containing protein n=1 Tax=Aspergillus novoparasiticus TaxID=986946 RepID=A0A5N6EV45_9EURO|nr:HotDog domain-containing protein [Aspergillus novoparasiticus]